MLLLLSTDNIYDVRNIVSSVLLAVRLAYVRRTVTEGRKASTPGTSVIHAPALSIWQKRRPSCTKSDQFFLDLLIASKETKNP
jgi:hypothetical protein